LGVLSMARAGAGAARGTVASMLDPQLYALFLTAALVLTFAPGPDTLFVLGASLGDGRRGGLLAAAGILTGLLLHICLAVAGVSALLAASPLAFDVLRLIGVGYLLWIGGVVLLRAWEDGGAIAALATTARSSRRLYWQGAATNVLNPKVAVFYVAFLPQFVAPELGRAPLQLLLLGVTHWLMGVPYLATVAVASGAVAGWLRRSPRLRRGLDAVSGFVFIGLALRLLMARRAPA
jgi:threonine/homoserine/homoserine lactone efflux protein